MPFEFGQWNRPTWRKQHSIPPAEDVFPDEREPEVTETAKCSKCGSDNLRPAGWFTSKLWDERHEDIQCKDCGKYSRLAVGVVLHKAEPSPPKPDPVVEANDSRPACPHCGGKRVHRRERLPAARPRKNQSGFTGVRKNGSGWEATLTKHGQTLHLGTFATPGMAAAAYEQAAKKSADQSVERHRWYCADCDRRFVADDSPNFVDHRRVEHFESDDPREEAAALFQLALAESDFDGVRSLIVISPVEEMVCRYFCAAGLVSEVMNFRDRVLVEYDALRNMQSQIPVGASSPI
jgi:DNA-directed RNA polymerase subunit RPC12/RpoP